MTCHCWIVLFPISISFLSATRKKLERLTSIAITLPGIIDTENGIVHRMPFYEDVKEMPLGEALEQHTGVPVYIQHDISAWTMAEALFGASRGARDVIQVVIDHNVGGGRHYRWSSATRRQQ